MKFSLHRLFKICFLTGILFLMLAGTVTMAQQIHTFVDVDSVSVGDSFSVSIILEGNYTLVSYPEAEDFEEDLEVKNRERFQVSATRDSIVYSLQFFGVEDITINPKEFQLQVDEQDTTLYSNQVQLFFKTTLAENDDEFRPFKPIFDFARSYWPYVVALLLLLLAAYSIYRYIKQRPTQQAYKAEPFRPKPFNNPLDELEKNLEQLKAGADPQNREEFEQFYIQLGDSIRLYLKRVYQFPALEMTSGEIIRQLQQERASHELIQKVKKVLYDADMVKFAKFNPASDQVLDAYRTATDFLETARTIDAEKVEYMKHQHEMDQKQKRADHEKKQQQEQKKENELVES